MSRNRLLLRSLYCCLVASLLSAPTAFSAGGAGRSVTWYLDGARISEEYAVDGGYREIILPASMKSGSLRVKSVTGGGISRVETVPVQPDRAAEKERLRLEERREELRDRLKALEVKEEIFKSTAKSQGSKVPKRTRTNPEPLASIRQGTDFALSRLEDVYRARRRAEHDMKEIDGRLTALRQREGAPGSLARIWLEGKRGTVLISYLAGTAGWQPVYDVRLADGEADVTLMARLPKGDRSAEISVVPASLSEGAGMGPFAVGRTPLPIVKRFMMPVVSRKQEESLQTSLAVTLRNDAGMNLPPGEASGFFRGEFLGVFPFRGAKQSETADLIFGMAAAGNATQ